MNKHLSFLFLLFFSSCGIYKSQFDCPAGKGLKCTSVGDVLDLVVEQEEGEDLLIKDKEIAEFLNQEPEKTPHLIYNPVKTLHLVKKKTGELAVLESKEETAP